MVFPPVLLLFKRIRFGDSRFTYFAAPAGRLLALAIELLDVRGPAISARIYVAIECRAVAGAIEFDTSDRKALLERPQ